MSSSIAMTASDDCPDDCHCSNIIVEQPHQSAGPYFHAKCTTVEGLRQIGKSNSLQSVDCSRIDLTKFGTALDKLTNLTRLDLSQNRLSEVPRLNRRIRTLNVAQNHITSAKLTQLPKYVQHLNLSHNEITYLPLELKALTHLRSIELHGNPINCSCETLQVRNWLTQQRVWTDKVVRCSEPAHWKGLPWLQVKDGDACDGDRIEDNELMFGDQPVMDDGSGAAANDDALETDYIPVRAAAVDSVVATYDEYDSGSGDDDAEYEEAQPVLARIIDGSGSGAAERQLSTSSPPVSPDVIEEDEDDGSGSGMPLLPIGVVIDRNSFLSETTSEELIEETTRAPFQMNIFNNGVQVHKLDDNDGETVSTKAPSEATDAPIVPGRMASSSASAGDRSKTADALPGIVSDADDDASKQTQSTYILLALLGFLLVGLIIFVIFRNKKAAKRRTRTDAENPVGRELQDMSKKPDAAKLINGNGNHAKAEIIPLMDHRQKIDEKPANGKSPAEEPLLKRLNGGSDNYAVDNQRPPSSHFLNENERPVEQLPTAPETERPAVDAVDEPEQKQQTVPPAFAYNDRPVEDDEVFQPVSPKPSRYSPVYSPITGRVKIKLTETPAPRTPMLVTRSRSNAGEIISTPVLRQSNNK